MNLGWQELTALDGRMSLQRTQNSCSATSVTSKVITAWSPLSVFVPLFLRCELHGQVIYGLFLLLSARAHVCECVCVCMYVCRGWGWGASLGEGGGGGGEWFAILRWPWPSSRTSQVFADLADDCHCIPEVTSPLSFCSSFPLLIFHF